MLDCLNFILACGSEISKVHSITNTSDFIDNKVVFISDPFQLSPFDHLLALVQARELNVIIHQYYIVRTQGGGNSNQSSAWLDADVYSKVVGSEKTTYFYIIIRTKRRLNSGGLD